MSELNERTGKRLKALLGEKNIKQYELAEKAGFTAQHISKLIKGKSRLTETTARCLSSVLGVRAEYLLCYDDYQTLQRKEENRYSHNDSGALLTWIIDDYVKPYSGDDLQTENYTHEWIITNNKTGDKYYCDAQAVTDFTKDILDYIQMRLEKNLLIKAKKITAKEEEKIYREHGKPYFSKSTVSDEPFNEEKISEQLQAFYNQFGHLKEYWK